MQTIFLPILLGAAIGWIAGIIRKGALKLDFSLNLRTLAVFFGGVVFGVTGHLDIEGFTMFHRLLTTAGIMSIFYLSWDYLQAKI